MIKTAVVTGAGTGVGREVVKSLAKDGWKVALAGRREWALKETAERAGLTAGAALILPLDVGDADAVNAMAATVMEVFGAVDVLVNSAGTNTPQRALREVSREDYHRIIDTNLHGTYYCVQAFLPGMRVRRSGTIVQIVSDAAIWGAPLAGSAYTVSKFGQRGLTQAINAEEAGNGIRACAILPGEIDTPILQLRPAPPPPESFASMLRPEDVARCVMLAIHLPPRAVVQELLLRPRR